jgi:prepilin-type processing-associated H-X9-DG protein
MKRRKKTNWLGWALLAALPWALVQAMFALGMGERRETCLNQVRKEAYAVLLYGQDWDETYPVKWKSRARCPEAAWQPTLGDSYALSPELAGKKWLRGAENQPLLLFESDAHGEFSPRHDGQGNVAFADGHAESRPQKERKQ